MVALLVVASIFVVFAVMLYMLANDTAPLEAVLGGVLFLMIAGGAAVFLFQYVPILERGGMLP